MKAMPFLNQVRRWAKMQPERTAVAVGARSLSYAQLQAAVEATLEAALRRADAPEGAAPEGAPRPLVTVVDRANGLDLAVEFCTAVAGDGVAAVLDPSWPAPLRASLTAAAAHWSAGRTRGVATGLADGPPESAFLLGFTSGTSALPKAFTRTRRSWTESFATSVRYFAVRPETVTLAPGPMSASMNLYALAECLAAGSTFRALPDFSADAVLDALADDGVTRLVLVPTVLALLAERGLATGRGPEAVRSIVCAGAALSTPALAAAAAWAPQAVIHQYYGASELGFVAAGVVAGPTATRPFVPLRVGGAFPGARLSIRDAAGVPLPAGQTGGIHVRSPYVSDGYAWGDDRLAFSSVPADDGGGPWSTVHDQGFLDAEGTLSVVGRASEMIVTGGNNVYPQQVEAALAPPAKSPAAGAKQPDVTVMVTGIADPYRGQRVVAGLYVDAPADAPDSFLRQALAGIRGRAALLAHQARPSRYYVATEPPLTRAGKPSRALLRDWIEKGDPRVRRLH